MVSVDQAEEEIRKVVAKQKELGYHVITDGEFRRTFWHLDFMWGFEGVEHKHTGNGVQFNEELAVLRKIRRRWLTQQELPILTSHRKNRELIRNSWQQCRRTISREYSIMHCL